MHEKRISYSEIREKKRLRKKYRFSYSTYRYFKRICQLDWSLERAHEAFAHIKLKKENTNE